ncbi:hypothetical protein H1C71_000111 [Ictidomys tridecemlineatus]|nr:hypothetical protein H1C71_000111 [Ictidomys tridecemlineatus]
MAVRVSQPPALFRALFSTPWLCLLLVPAILTGEMSPQGFDLISLQGQGSWMVFTAVPWPLEFLLEKCLFICLVHRKTRLFAFVTELVVTVPGQVHTALFDLNSDLECFLKRLLITTHTHTHTHTQPGPRVAVSSVSALVIRFPCG